MILIDLHVKIHNIPIYLPIRATNFQIIVYYIFHNI